MSDDESRMKPEERQAMLDWQDSHRKAHSNSNSPYGHICDDNCWTTGIWNYLEPFVAQRAADAREEVSRRLEDLADWHVTKAEKAVKFPGAEVGVMLKAAEVHRDAARRIRATLTQTCPECGDPCAELVHDDRCVECSLDRDALFGSQAPEPPC